MENNYIKFRKAAFGGFNREDVINYIEKMRNEFFDYKKEVESTITQLNEKVRELEAVSALHGEQDIKADTYEAEAEKDITADPVNDINEATNHLRMVADELCKSLCDFMDRVSENTVSVVIEKSDSEQEFDEDAAVVVSESSDEEKEIEEEIKEDKVASILKATDSFCCYADVLTQEQAEEVVQSEKRNILDVLSGASFLN